MRALARNGVIQQFKNSKSISRGKASLLVSFRFSNFLRATVRLIILLGDKKVSVILIFYLYFRAGPSNFIPAIFARNSCKKTTKKLTVIAKQSGFELI